MLFVLFLIPLNPPYPAAVVSSPLLVEAVPNPSVNNVLIDDYADKERAQKDLQAQEIKATQRKIREAVQDALKYKYNDFDYRYIYKLPESYKFLIDFIKKKAKEK